MRMIVILIINAYNFDRMGYYSADINIYDVLKSFIRLWNVNLKDDGRGVFTSIEMIDADIPGLSASTQSLISPHR